MNSNVRIIAFYLPQFHPTKNNDLWWGKGFTEWTNVGKAKPLFRGHKQPKVPADLGYYDLRLSEVRKAQADMARDAGIEGFCYYHYWFGNGHVELDMPFNEVVRLGEPDFPFCLCWANESWHKKFWNMDGTTDKQILAEQVYENEEGNTKHFYALLDAFKDKRYIRVNGKLLFAIYKPLEFKKIKEFMDLWNKLAKKEGLNGFYFVGQTYDTPDIDKILGLGMNACNIIHLWDCFQKRGILLDKIHMFYRKLFHRPRIISYEKVIEKLVTNRESDIDVIPTIIPNWDHTPRSGMGGTVIIKSSPSLFKKHVLDVLNIIEKKPADSRLVFLKSWNEWGEGNYMEPDLIWGNQYLDTLKKLVLKYKKEL